MGGRVRIVAEFDDGMAKDIVVSARQVEDSDEHEHTIKS